MMKKLYHILFFVCFIFGSVYTQAQQKDVLWGVVTDKTTKEPMIGVTVVEVNENNRIESFATTNINGEYVLTIKNRNDKISFSFIGYKSHTTEIGEKMVYDVVLVESTTAIETVNISAEKRHNDGTFSIPQREISTAVQTISTKEFEGMQVTSVDEALQGRIAGLDIVANSGDPGSGTTMRIRGASTINGNATPLIVVNGIPWQAEIDQDFDYANSNQEQYANMLSLNPDDIESITVLKDAASTAVWGSKGANGVLMITTKRGVRGPTRFTYSNRTTVSRQPKGLKLLTGDQYTMMMKQALFNPAQDEFNVNAYNYDENFAYFEEFNNNTDWVKEVTQLGFIQDHYLTASGGGERASFRVSAGFFDQTGTVIGQKYNRITSRAYLEYRVSTKLKFITEFSFSYSKNDKNYVRDNSPSMLGIAYRKMPNVSVYEQDAYGNNTDVYFNIPRSLNLSNNQKDLKNPVALALLARNRAINYRVAPTFRIQYNLLKSLQYNSYITFDMNNDISDMFLPIEATNLAYDADVNWSEYNDKKSLTVQTDHNLTWTPNFVNEDHSLTTYGAFVIRTGYSDPIYLSSYGIPSFELSNAANEALPKEMSSTTGQWRSMAFLMRGHYAYKSKYILGFSIRADGSTKFGNNNKFGTFRGLSGKWIVSDEDFMIPTRHWLSMAGLRMGYGEAGNPPKYEYLHFSRYSSQGNYSSMPVVVPNTLSIDNLTWEKSSSVNLGLDLGFFDDKIIIDANVYKSLTKDLLWENLPIPSTSGHQSISYANVGKMENIGWEFNMNANSIIEINEFKVDFSLNFANNRNTLIELKDELLESFNGDYDYKNGTYLTRVQEGNSYGSIYGFHSKGVYRYNEYEEGMNPDYAPVAKDKHGNVVMDSHGDPVPVVFAYGVSGVDEYQFKGGDAIYEDINHDGSIDELDIVYLGNSNPKLNGGFGSVFRYKQLSLSAFFNFRLGNKILNSARMNLENMYYDDNQSVAVNYRWRKDGDVTEIPRALYNYGYNWLGSDRFVENGSFLRFKYLTFRYKLPKKTLERIGMNQMSFYTTINNLGVFSRYTGVDPEVGYGSLGISHDKNQTPRTKEVTFGISITF